MANKQLVRRIYPKACCRISAYGQLHDHMQLYLIEYSRFGRAFGWGPTPAKAWKDAADTIKKEMVESLES